MPLHLVTGYKGTPHITAEDVGSFNAGVVGSGEYVLDIGNKFAASLTSNNTVKILDGELIIQGRHISLKKDTYEELTISNGSAGKMRSDLIVVRYTKDASTGIENAVLAVKRGQPGTNEAVDPECTTGDILSGNCTLHEMPLYRIILNGLDVSEPKKLFTEIDSLTGTKGLIYKGWNPLSNKTDDTPNFWKNKGSGFWMIDLEDILIDQPSRWGILFNTVCAEEMSQIFIVQASGEIYRRSANGLGWYGRDWEAGTWTAVYDKRTFPIQISDYWGTGTFGAENPNTLTFNFEPKLMIVLSSDDAPIKLFAVNGLPFVNTFSGSSIHNNYCVTLLWNGRTVSWYNSGSRADCQLNSSGIHYYCIAIG